MEQGQSTILLLYFIQPVHIQLLLKLGMLLLKALLHFNHSVVQSSASFLGTDSLWKQPLFYFILFYYFATQIMNYKQNKNDNK